MDRGRVFFDGGARYTLVRAFDADVGEAGVGRLPSHEARWALARVLGSRGGREIAMLYSWLLDGALSVCVEADVRRMREALLDAAQREHVLVLEERLIGSATRREVDDGPSTSRPAPAAQEEKTWIEIVLTDDASPPQPMAFVPYQIELPDQSTRQGILDANGRARLDGIDPGSCKVSFPSLDGSDWR